MKMLALIAFACALGATLGQPAPATAGPRCGFHRHWVGGHYAWWHGHRHWVGGHCV